MLTCTGGLTKAAVAGQATFAGCTIDRAGTGYQLRATGSGLATATSTPFAVTVGPAARLVVRPSPAAGRRGRPSRPAGGGGGRRGRQHGAGATDPVTVAIAANPGAGTLACPGGTTVGALAGVATFGACSIDRAAAGYTVTASAAGLAPVTSATFTISPAAPAALVVTTQPSGGTGGIALPGQPVVKVVDAYGNVVTSATTPISLALTPGSGTA